MDAAVIGEGDESGSQWLTIEFDGGLWRCAALQGDLVQGGSIAVMELEAVPIRWDGGGHVQRIPGEGEAEDFLDPDSVHQPEDPVYQDQPGWPAWPEAE